MTRIAITTLKKQTRTTPEITASSGATPQIQHHDAKLSAWIERNAGKYDPEFEEYAMFCAETAVATAQEAGGVAAVIGTRWISCFDNWLIMCEDSPFRTNPSAAALTLPITLGGTDYVNVRLESYKTDEESLDTSLEDKWKVQGEIGNEFFRGCI